MLHQTAIVIESVNRYSKRLVEGWQDKPRSAGILYIAPVVGSHTFGVGVDKRRQHTARIFLLRAKSVLGATVRFLQESLRRPDHAPTQSKANGVG